MIWRRLAKSAQDYITRVKDPFNLPSELPLYRFASAEDLEQWGVYSDAALGGSTSAALVPCEAQQGTASFRGNISSQVDDPGSRLQRSGFCGMNTDVAEGVLDLDDYDTLAFRVRGDGRKYIASLRTENWMVDAKSQDVWQAFLFARKGEWAEVEVPIERFLQTWKGRLVDTEEAMNPGRIVGMGISVAGAGEREDDGHFQLDLDWIRARRLHATF